MFNGSNTNASPSFSSRFGAGSSNSFPRHYGAGGWNHPSTSQGHGHGQGIEQGHQEPSSWPSQLVDNSSAVTHKIATLYAEKLLSDITLVLNGREYPAHRLLLCASSDVFQVMLMNPNWTESKESRVVLQETPETEIVFEEFLKYLYTGRVTLFIGNVCHILTLADKYNVKDLIELCLAYMADHVPVAAEHNQLVSWWLYTHFCQHSQVAKLCENYLKWNLESIYLSSDLVNLNQELLTVILLQDDVVVEDEFTLFKYVEYWISGQEEIGAVISGSPEFEARMFQLVQHLMYLIRFPLMTPRQLAELLLSPVVAKYKDVIMDLMRLGMAYQSSSAQQDGCLEEILFNHPYSSKLFTPRLYTSERWSVELSCNNFEGVPHYQCHTMVFSTPISFSDSFPNRQIEWVVELYPKGVCFLKGILIFWQRSLEIPEHVLKTVRLTVNCKNNGFQEDLKFQIGILVTGSIDTMDSRKEFIKYTTQKTCIFSAHDKVLNIDDIIPYHKLVPCAACTCKSKQSGDCNDSTMCLYPHSKDPENMIPGTYLVGSDKNRLKVRVVITPLREFNI